jgi:hypothetical protein
MGWRDYSLSTYEGNMVSGDMTAFLSGLSEEDRYIFEERAAIIEFEGGLTRAESEKRARSYMLRIGEGRSQTG